MAAFDIAMAMARQPGRSNEGRPRFCPPTSTVIAACVGLDRRADASGSLSGALATSRIPHITYVKDVDMTALEELRAAMNRDRHEDRDKLTFLPFLIKAMARGIETHPAVNATCDDEAGIVS